MRSDNITTDFTDEPVCPYCGYEDDFWWESVRDYTPSLGDGDEFINTCPECDKEYDVVMFVETTFDSHKREDK